ncbi:hypothetical protein LCGC14_0347970 [marine sediment metagenome]|uniref:ATPase AAA-type core domain-containing protein n=1 Tax=marine sediment metagenome TaxID=412755 RepID=A0A0F9TBS0_9ZZZZ
MAITVITGPMGSGKTTLMTAVGVLAHELDGVRIFCNYRLTGIEHTFFRPTEFADLMEAEELNNCIVLLDEAYLLMDSRTSGARINRLFSAFTYQARKRGVDLLVVTHHTDHIDKRIRRAMSYRWRPRFNPTTHVITVYSKAEEVGHRSRFKIQADKFWPYFDTNEIPIISKQLKRVVF